MILMAVEEGEWGFFTRDENGLPIHRRDSVREDYFSAKPQYFRRDQDSETSKQYDPRKLFESILPATKVTSDYLTTLFDLPRDVSSFLEVAEFEDVRIDLLRDLIHQGRITPFLRMKCYNALQRMLGITGDVDHVYGAALDVLVWYRENHNPISGELFELYESTGLVIAPETQEADWENAYNAARNSSPISGLLNHENDHLNDDFESREDEEDFRRFAREREGYASNMDYERSGRGQTRPKFDKPRLGDVDGHVRYLDVYRDVTDGYLTFALGNDADFFKHTYFGGDVYRISRLDLLKELVRKGKNIAIRKVLGIERGVSDTQTLQIARQVIGVYEKPLSAEKTREQKQNSVPRQGVSLDDLAQILREKKSNLKDYFDGRIGNSRVGIRDVGEYVLERSGFSDERRIEIFQRLKIMGDDNEREYSERSIALLRQKMTGSRQPGQKPDLSNIHTPYVSLGFAANALGISRDDVKILVSQRKLHHGLKGDIKLSSLVSYIKRANPESLKEYGF